MPSRESELYKDKIEVSLDGRQIFYLFFGGAVIVGLVFVLGVMVGRRVEARGHLDRADTSAATDPLAALDRLERSDNLSFHGALTGVESPTDVEKAIGEIEKQRTAGHGERADKPVPSAVAAAGAEPHAARPEAATARPAPHPDVEPPPGEPATRLDADKARANKREGDKREGDKREGDKREADKREGDKREADKREGEKKARKHEDTATSSKSDHADSRDREGRDVRTAEREGKPSKADGKAEGKTDGKTEGKTDGKTEGKTDGKTSTKADSHASGEGKARYTLQLSSFQDRSEAESFLSAMKSAGFQPYLTEAEVSGKGTFYRVRLGSYRSLDAASDAKAEYEKSSKKTAQVMRL